MLEDISPFWLIFGAIAVVSVVTSFGRRIQTRAIRDTWVEAADRLGFAMGVGRSLSMSGAKRGLHATVEVRTNRSDKTVTRYGIQFPPLGAGIKLRRQSGWQGVLTALGDEDIEIGDAIFDERFVVKASSPQLAHRYFTPERVAALNTLHDQHPGFMLDNDELALETAGMEKDAGTIEATVSNLMRVARVLEHDEGIAGDGSGDPPESKDFAPSAWAAEALADVEEDARDQEIQRVFETVEEYAEEKGEEEANEAVPSSDGLEEAAVAPLLADADALLVATRLFGKQQLDFEVERLFNEEFQGRSVDWSGTVKRPAGLMAARLFDDDRAVLVIEVASLDDELYGTTAVDAIVAFPKTAAPDLGEEVRFTGRLVDVDGVSKDIFVADGRLN